MPRQPTSPAEILREEFLSPLNLSPRTLASHMACDEADVSALLAEERSVDAAMALRLGSVFQTTPEFWLNAQRAVDLYRARIEVAELPPPLKRAS